MPVDRRVAPGRPTSPRASAHRPVRHSLPGGRLFLSQSTRRLAGLLLIPLLGCAAASRRPAVVGPAGIASAPAVAAGGTLGIPPFAITEGAAGVDSALSPLAYALADLLTTDLARSRRVTLVERARLGEVLRELDLVTAGRVDSATAPRLGRLLQARRLVVGRVTALPGGGTRRDIRLGVQLADVEQGTLETAVDASAPLADVLAAEKALAFRLFDALGVALAPDERAAVEQHPTRDIAALLAYGQGVRLQLAGDYRGATAAFRRAARLDPQFRAARARATEARGIADAGVVNPVLVPGVHAVGAAVGVTVDRLNRPLDLITTFTTSGARTTDPAFAAATATVVITVTRP